MLRILFAFDADPRRPGPNDRVLARRQRLSLLLAAVGLAGVLALAGSLQPDSRRLGTHEPLGLPPCSIRSLIGLRCPTCGMTIAWANPIVAGCFGAEKSPRFRDRHFRQGRLSKAKILSKESAMDRLRTRTLLAGTAWMALVLSVAGGCSVLPFIAYLYQGLATPAEYDGLKGKRVAVICRPVASLQYQSSSVSRELSLAVASLLEQNVKHIKLVDQDEVDKWEDENNWDNYIQIGKALKADMVVGNRSGPVQPAARANLVSRQGQRRDLGLRLEQSDQAAGFPEIAAAKDVSAQCPHSGSREALGGISAAVRRCAGGPDRPALLRSRFDPDFAADSAAHH